MLPIHRYRLCLTALRAHAPPIELPVLRGAWGAALRAQFCETGASSCDGCPVARRCTYRSVFDPLPPESHALGALSSVPPAYVLGGIEPAAEGARLSLTLMGPAQHQAPALMSAMARALGDGLGKERHPYRAGRPEHLHAGAWHPITTSPPPVPPTLHVGAPLGVASGGTQAVRIELLSPVRLQEQGRIVDASHFTPRRWLMAVVRRVGLLADLYGTPLALDFPKLAAIADGVAMAQSELAWQEGERWSARQKKVHPMGGVTGQFVLRGALDDFMPWLASGTWLHVGKHAAFGQGRYRMTILPDA